MDHGTVKKWADRYGLTIEVTQFNDYVESINQCTAGSFEAVTVTNMDALSIPAGADPLPFRAEGRGKELKDKFVDLPVRFNGSDRSGLPKPTEGGLHGRKVGEVDVKQAMQLHQPAMFAVR